MSGVNKFFGIGNLGQDPSTRYMPNGEAVTNISIGITETWKDKASGERKESTEWVRVVFYRSLAEIAGKYLTKGSLVYVEGKLQTRKWTDKAGVERYTTEVISDVMRMLGSKQGQAKDSDDPRNYPADTAEQTGRPQQFSTPENFIYTDIPF